MGSADYRVSVEGTSLFQSVDGRARNKRQKWKLLVCLMGGALFWLCDRTDYSLAGTWPDLFIPVVGMMAGVVALRASGCIPRRALRAAAKVAAAATLLEGTLIVGEVLLLAAISPAGVLLAAFAIFGEQQKSAVVSPDGWRVAEEYYRGGGLLGDDVKIVRVKYRLMPLLEREVYIGPISSLDQVAWQDNDTLIIPGTGDRVELGLVKAKSGRVQLGIAAWGLLEGLANSQRWLEEQRKQDEEMSRPLKVIPLYPGGIESDNSGANMNTNGGFRAFDIKAPNSDEAAKWYKGALSMGEWSIVGTKRRETRGETASSVGEERLVYNCIEALRREADGTSKHYYWRFLWGEQSTSVRVIVETPDPPAVNDCDDAGDHK
jgi:hypothetical protein